MNRRRIARSPGSLLLLPLLALAGCDQPGSSINDSVVITTTPPESPKPAPDDAHAPAAAETQPQAQSP